MLLRWRSVVGFEGLYDVSNIGTVRNAITKESLKPYINNGSRQVILSRSAVDKKCVKVAMLVAQAFLKNPLGLTQLNHKDGNKLNDMAINLEWRSLGKPIVVLNENGYMSIHPSATSAAAAYGYSPQLVSRKCINGTATREGLYFKYTS